MGGAWNPALQLTEITAGRDRTQSGLVWTWHLEYKGDSMPRTADELDFIIDYDIKYRMGRDAKEGDADAD